MKNIPKTIFLQVDADGEMPESFEALSEVSWCKDRIYKTDIEYRLIDPDQESLKLVDITYHPSHYWADQRIFTTACYTTAEAIKEFWEGKNREAWEVLRVIVRKEIH